MGSGWAYRGLAVRLFGLKFACSADDDVLQPANRFWLFQGIETAIYGGLAFALIPLAVWWVRRRLA